MTTQSRRAAFRAPSSRVHSASVNTTRLNADHTRQSAGHAAGSTTLNSAIGPGAPLVATNSADSCAALTAVITIGCLPAWLRNCTPLPEVIPGPSVSTRPQAPRPFVAGLLPGT